MPHLLRCVSLLYGLLMMVSVARAQASQSAVSLSGMVESAEHQPVKGVSISIMFLPMSHGWATTTAPDGRFSLKGLPPGGPYVIQASQPGYKTQLLQNIFLSESSPNTIAVALVRQGSAHGAATPALPVATASVQPKADAPEPPRTYRYKAKTPKIGTAITLNGHYDATTGNFIYDTGAPTTLKLPNGSRLAGVGENSTENRLFQFLQTSARPDTVDLTQGWLNFDRVYFETGRATLTPASMQQLRNVATLLRAYPQARLKIGGYTDAAGDARMNRQLSEARARTAWAALVDMGISPGRLDARGYGPNYAIAPNTTPEGRAMNRRLSLKVLAN